MEVYSSDCVILIRNIQETCIFLTECGFESAYIQLLHSLDQLSTNFAAMLGPFLPFLLFNCDPDQGDEGDHDENVIEVDVCGPLKTRPDSCSLFTALSCHSIPPSSFSLDDHYDDHQTVIIIIYHHYSHWHHHHHHHLLADISFDYDGMQAETIWRRLCKSDKNPPVQLLIRS